MRDTIPSRRFPVLGVTLIAVNVVVFLCEFFLGRRVGPFVAGALLLQVFKRRERKRGRA